MVISVSSRWSDLARDQVGLCVQGLLSLPWYCGKDLSELGFLGSFIPRNLLSTERTSEK